MENKNNFEIDAQNQMVVNLSDAKEWWSKLSIEEKQKIAKKTFANANKNVNDISNEGLFAMWWHNIEAANPQTYTIEMSDGSTIICKPLDNTAKIGDLILRPSLFGRCVSTISKIDKHFVYYKLTEIGSEIESKCYKEQCSLIVN